MVKDFYSSMNFEKAEEDEKGNTILSLRWESWNGREEKLSLRKCYIDKEGNETGIYKFDSNGANKALDMLMKHTGGYETHNKQKAFNISVNREAVEVEGNSI